MAEPSPQSTAESSSSVAEAGSLPTPPPSRARRRWGWWMLAAVVGAGLLVLLASTGWGAALGGSPEGARLVRMQGSRQYGDGRFVNPHPTAHLRRGSMSGTLWEFFSPRAQVVPPAPLPLVEDTAHRLETPPASGLRLTWLGHSTVLVELDGFRLLTDPMWSERASPSSLVGPRRFHAPPLPLAQLGRLDAVLLSHDHYDHLDMETIRALAARGAVFYVPLGVGAHLERWGVAASQVKELDWWEEASPREGLRLVSTPSQHFSGRGVLDRNRTLWTSWTLLGPTHRVFFSGDTGLTPDFEEVGRRFGPFDVAMFEVGAFHDAWGDIHLGPKNALEAFRRVRGRVLLPIHWSTFNLALHAWSEPAETLWGLAHEAGVPLMAPRIGEPVEPGAEATATPWWRSVKEMPRSARP